MHISFRAKCESLIRPTDASSGFCPGFFRLGYLITAGHVSTGSLTLTYHPVIFNSSGVDSHRKGLKPMKET